MEISQIINNIFAFVNFWLPGYVFLRVFSKISSLKLKDSVDTHIFAVVFSLIIRWMLSVIPPLRDGVMIAQSYYYCALCCVVGMVIACILSRVYRCETVNKVFSDLFSKSLYDSIWEDVIDLKNGSSMYIKMRNGDSVFGTTNTIEENGNDSWVALDYYEMKDKDGNRLCSCEDHDNKSLLMIRMSDIAHCQVKSCKK